MMHDLKWLVNTNAGLIVRIALGCLFFLMMAIADISRNGREAKRWREYLVLVIAVIIAMSYGALNDQLTSRISWEYFYYGKDLQAMLGPKVPPSAGKLSWEAAKVGVESTWSAGLIIGVAFLLANNPNKTLPQLPIRRLIARIWIVILCCIACAALLGAIGYRGGLVWISDDFREMVARNEFRPYQFMAVYGIHLGGYVGGLLGMIRAVISILRERAKLINPPPPVR
jgi:hypothetical protein